MITYLTGKIINYSLEKESSLEILLNNGVGYKVLIPSLYNNILVGDNIEIYTHFHVREDAQTLYGFKTRDERDFFQILISVSGIGPKIGLAIISTYDRKELEEIIGNGDAKKLSKVSGLGMKGAQKIILDLRGKIDFDQTESKSADDSKLKELKQVLKTLGFAGDQLKDGIEYAEGILNVNSDIEIEDLVKKVLNHD
jgi:Holliday junction DNA helicase RuvA